MEDGFPIFINYTALPRNGGAVFGRIELVGSTIKDWSYPSLDLSKPK
jgi:hypothetical protein